MHIYKTIEAANPGKLDKKVNELALEDWRVVSTFYAVGQYHATLQKGIKGHAGSTKRKTKVSKTASVSNVRKPARKNKSS